MKASRIKRVATPEYGARRLRANRRQLQSRMHEGGTTTVRTDSYKGHAIEIRTTYEITIDGTPVLGHLEVSNNGQVHYHPIPNYSSESAIDLLRHVIDTFPEEFAGPARKGKGSKPSSGRTGGPAHGGHHR